MVQALKNGLVIGVKYIVVIAAITILTIGVDLIVGNHYTRTCNSGVYLISASIGLAIAFFCGFSFQLFSFKVYHQIWDRLSRRSTKVYQWDMSRETIEKILSQYLMDKYCPFIHVWYRLISSFGTFSYGMRVCVSFPVFQI